MQDITLNYSNLKSRIQEICASSNIKYPIELIAVSKTHPAENILQLYNDTGHAAFAENYAHELQHKAVALSNYPIQWHFIGSPQSNKIKIIAKYASWVHSLTSSKHALQLNQARENILLPKLNVLIEVNISQDIHKHGLTSFDEIMHLANTINTQKHLLLRGLMGLSGVQADLKTQNQQFGELKHLFDKLKAMSDKNNIDTLSMGMSNDFAAAIKNGSTMLRVGSMIFGERRTR